MGERTAARGFVLAPMIQAGKLVDAVGGGVSQVATTFYNAAFFAGLELIEHTPHEFYISRYPMGREATVSWGAGAIFGTTAGGYSPGRRRDTSITVRFTGQLGRRRDRDWQSYAYIAARTIRILNCSSHLGPRRSSSTGHLPHCRVYAVVYRGNS
jgi:hypothetical protein